MVVNVVGVLGAGNMGSGIAQNAAQSGFEVRMVDQSEDLVKKGLQRIRSGSSMVPGGLEAQVAKGKMSQQEADGIIGRIKGSADFAILSDADIIIEAVFEEFEVKQKVFAKVDAVAKKECIIASNTSSLSIEKLVGTVSEARRGRFGGLHYFNPAQINKLVEVMGCSTTTPETHRALLSFARAVGKVPIVVKDSPGFAVNRYFVPLLNEACRCLDEGISPASIEKGAKESLGIGLGPFDLLNLTGIPIGHHSQSSLYRELGGYYKPVPKLDHLMKEGGLDFEYDAEGDPQERKAVGERFLGVVFSIVSKIVEEGVASPRDVDIGALVGLRWSAGPCEMMNRVGLKRAAALAEGVEKKSNGELPVPKLLRAMVKKGGKWDLPMVASEPGAVTTIRIRRPEALNALNDQVLVELAKAVDAAAKDKDARVIVITGEANAFIAGADIKRMLDGTLAEIRKFTLLGQKLARSMEKAKKPVIAVVNGFAFGGGTEMALACDFIIAADAAQFGLPEVGLGIHPGYGGTQRLPRIVGRSNAKYLTFTGAHVSAREAKEMGFVAKVVPRNRLYDEAEKVAQGIAEKGPLAVAYAKDAIDRGLDTTLDKGLGIEVANNLKCFGTADQKEGMTAFVEKRKAVFKGR